jgi:PPOX class probable F420-dependent enzyme
MGIRRHVVYANRMAITVARFLDVADGLQPGQFTVGDHDTVGSLSDLDPTYKQLLDQPVTATVSVTGGDGRSNLTPVWFDYEDDLVLLNLATHRKKVGWLRKNPQATFLLMNPANSYHWLSIKCTVSGEVSEDDPEHGARVTAQLNKIYTKYTGDTGPYALRDPSIDERRVLFEFTVDRVATFGKP